MLQGGWEGKVVELEEHRRRHLFGKYRAVVTDPDDPDRMGRIKVKASAVWGDVESPWCVPVVPFAGKDHGLLLLPQKGDGVFVEFEGGNPSRPLWSGCWWGKGELPDPQGPRKRVLTTPKKLQIVLDDDAPKLQLLHPGGAEITLTDSAITIKIGSSAIELSAEGVKVNGGALEVK
jgi:uncharacterized protein involved in type VI secretion and phage assembly